ncbi:hypothetical protein J4221_07325 [Candidatus Pacearchaeota archaeon]|nr:hypothetical protein [Candidatus Pacearchaeota archaeon]
MIDELTKKLESPEKCPLGNPFCNRDACFSPDSCPRTQARYSSRMRDIEGNETSFSYPFSRSNSSRDYRGNKDHREKRDSYHGREGRHYIFNMLPGDYRSRDDYINTDYHSEPKGAYSRADPIKSNGVSRFGYRPGEGKEYKLC